MKHDTLTKVSNSSLRQRVAEGIRDAVFKGSLQPGQKLAERELAAQLGCSQATVREALVQLEAEGFITKKLNAATFVATFSPAEMAGAFAVRRLLEGYAVEEAARLATPEQIQVLERGYLEMVQAALAGDRPLYNIKDRLWHEAIWEISGNAYLLAALRRFVLPQVTFAAVLVRPGEPAVSVADARTHLPLLEALKAKDPERCRKALGDAMTGWENMWRGAAGNAEASGSRSATESRPGPVERPMIAN